MCSTAAKPGENCPVCGGRIVATIPYPGHGGTTAALHFESIGICDNCGLGVAEPRPSQSDLDAYYVSGAYWGASAGSNAQLAHERNQARHRVLHCLAHFAQGGPVADVGAGHGTIAEWLDRLTSKRVHRYDFIEPDADKQKRILALRTRFAIACADGPTELGDDYALLFLNQVLEHVANPFAFLSDFASRLRPGGIAYVETPHADYRFKDNVFPHTLFFTASALRQLAARLGLEVLECETFGMYPGAAGAIHPRTFRWISAVFHLTAHRAPSTLSRILDDSIWRYRPIENGMWLRSILRRPL